MDEKNDRAWRWTGVPAGCGILAIRNRQTGRSYYVGVADLRQRAYDHHRWLCRNEHHNVELQRDWTNNPDNFEFVVVETVRSPRLLNVFKQVWIERGGISYNRKNAIPLDADD